METVHDWLLKKLLQLTGIELGREDFSSDSDRALRSAWWDKRAWTTYAGAGMPSKLKAPIMAVFRELELPDGRPAADDCEV
jgi:hypothetical protein